jgi:hypothetical protein
MKPQNNIGYGIRPLPASRATSHPRDTTHDPAHKSDFITILLAAALIGLGIGAFFTKFSASTPPTH